jgi:hypothetical protein
MFEPLVFRPERKNVGNIDAYSWRGYYSNTFIYHGIVAQNSFGTVWFWVFARKSDSPCSARLSLFMQRPSSGLLMAPTASDDTISAAVKRGLVAVGEGPALPSGIAIRSYSDKRLSMRLTFHSPLSSSKTKCSGKVGRPGCSIRAPARKLAALTV